ncbi:universal stress protein [Parerythrobacter aestuarii]|uniref:universal stress protein n=1 Tax=Parerythrobacter aestuarii TaxID=3020909 RepID=UPI0024DEFE7C|nr:universal stress protein [Parerythrobacter aestuarii]
MRVFLVIIDETEEALKALRWASRRAVAVDGVVHILALVQPQNFNAFGSIQATIEQEARDRAEAVASSAAGSILAESGNMPQITVKVGEGKKVIAEYLEEHPEVHALVLAAGEQSSGPLVMHFSESASTLPCPLFIVPGGFTNEDIDRVT